MKIEKVAKLVVNLHDKPEYVIDIRNIKQAVNHGLVLKKVHGVMVKPYIDMNNDLRKAAENDFEKDFSSWWIIQFSEKLWKMFKSKGK